MEYISQVAHQMNRGIFTNHLTGHIRVVIIHIWKRDYA
jgi:hypothetical protein